jgi:hypothetical protein
MALNRSPIFANSVDTVFVAIATADTSLTAPTNYGVLYANSTGVTVEITKIRFKAIASTTASQVRVFIHDGASTHYLLREYKTDTVSVDATTKSFEVTDEEPIYLQTGYALRTCSQMWRRCSTRRKG